ncbi:MAG: hypothetical protein AB2815_10070 [Candidatus Sedimenticola endophacoides]
MMGLDAVARLVLPPAPGLPLALLLAFCVTCPAAQEADGVQSLLSDADRAYLKQKGSICYVVDPEWLPYEAIREGRHVGIAADYFALVLEHAQYADLAERLRRAVAGYLFEPLVELIGAARALRR